MLISGAKSAAGVIMITDKLVAVPEVNATLIVMVLESGDPEVYGLILLAAAGSMVRKNMTSQEWSGALRSTTAFRKGRRIEFGMDMPILLYLRLPEEADFRKVSVAFRNIFS